MSKRSIALVVATLAIALIAVGCGGDDETSTSSITKAEFIKQADAACKEGDKEIEKKFGAYLKENVVKESEESEAEITARSAEIADTILLPGYHRELEDLSALEVPSGDEDEVEAILDALEEAIERSEEDARTALMSNTEIFRVAKGLSEEYGLKVCGY